MRIITITIKEMNNGENASIDVVHAKSGEHSDMELAVVNLLNNYLYEEVCEISDKDGNLKIPNSPNQKQNVKN